MYVYIEHQKCLYELMSRHLERVSRPQCGSHKYCRYEIGFNFIPSSRSYKHISTELTKVPLCVCFNCLGDCLRQKKKNKSIFICSIINTAVSSFNGLFRLQIRIEANHYLYVRYEIVSSWPIIRICCTKNLCYYFF